VTDFPTENDAADPSSQKEQTDHQNTTFHDIPDHFFAALTNRRRRCVLAYLSNGSSDSATMQELVDDIAAREHGNRADSFDEIEITLFHHHLPKLADTGFIEFDKRSKIIRYRDNTRVESLLTYFQEYSPE
jgi:DNA-binding transcriptional ArsR family regulator